MSGLLPQGCRTVNEAAAWAILEAHNGELQQRLGTKRTDQRVFVVLHFNLTHWLALRNDWARLDAANKIAQLLDALDNALDFTDHATNCTHFPCTCDLQKSWDVWEEYQ